MSEDGTPICLEPAGPEAIALAREWFTKPHEDEAAALLALELIVQRAIDLGAAKASASQEAGR